MKELSGTNVEKPTAVAEFFCVCLTAMAMPLVMMGFGVWKVTELIREIGRKSFWVD